MIDKGRFEKLLARYLSDYPRQWNEDQEYYKARENPRRAYITKGDS